VTFNPWKPPSGWDGVDAEPSGGPLTVRGVLKAGLAAIRRQPLALFFAICVVPGLWAVPSTIAYDRFVSADEPLFGPGRSFRAIALSWASLGWDSVWVAGQLGAALDALRGQPIRWQRFLSGLSLAPLVFLSWLAVTLPLDALALLPASLGGAPASAFEAVGIAISTYVAVRALLWVPFIVDARLSVGESLARSVTATRGHLSKIVALGLILALVALPLAVVEVIVFETSTHVFSAVLDALYVLCTAQLYLVLRTDAERGS
jgi:hypothetical protein